MVIWEPLLDLNTLLSCQNLGQAFSQPKAFYMASTCFSLKINAIMNNNNEQRRYFMFKIV